MNKYLDSYGYAYIGTNEERVIEKERQRYILCIHTFIIYSERERERDFCMEEAEKERD